MHRGGHGGTPSVQAHWTSLSTNVSEEWVLLTHVMKCWCTRWPREEPKMSTWPGRMNRKIFYESCAMNHLCQLLCDNVAMLNVRVNNDNLYVTWSCSSPEIKNITPQLIFFLGSWTIPIMQSVQTIIIRTNSAFWPLLKKTKSERGISLLCKEIDIFILFFI